MTEDLQSHHPAGEIVTLTSLRAIAALYVLLYHFDAAYGPFTYLIRRTSHVIDHGYLGVDIFFVLSGFIMQLNYGKHFEHISKDSFLAFVDRKSVV